MTVIASSARILSPQLLQLGVDVHVHDFAVIGQPNQLPDVCSNDDERRITIGDGTMVGTHALIYEGARIGRRVMIDPRCVVGSHSMLGDDSRLLYGAQVHDNVRIGEHSFIRGFVCDNSVIGNNSYVFGDLIHKLKGPHQNRWDETDEIGPTIEDGVLVGWGAVIIGRVTIGTRARIRPGTIVRENVEPGVTYGGSSAAHS